MHARLDAAGGERLAKMRALRPVVEHDGEEVVGQLRVGRGAQRGGQPIDASEQVERFTRSVGPGAGIERSMAADGKMFLDSIAVKGIIERRGDSY